MHLESTSSVEAGTFGRKQRRGLLEVVTAFFRLVQMTETNRYSKTKLNLLSCIIITITVRETTPNIRDLLFAMIPLIL